MGISTKLLGRVWAQGGGWEKAAGDHGGPSWGPWGARGVCKVRSALGVTPLLAGTPIF